MDLYDIFAGAESFHMRKLLEHARGLSDAQLDKPLDNPARVFPWDSPAQSLRELLRRLVSTKEIWTAALTGGVIDRFQYRAAGPTPRPTRFSSRLEKADGTVQSDSRRRAQSQRLERHLRRCAVRAAGDVLLRGHVRARGHLQCLPAAARARRPAALGRQGRGVRLPDQDEASVAPTR